MLDEVYAAMSAIAPAGTAVVDLFAGTGVVSERLARTWEVLSFDVQEYSRVLTSGLASPVPFNDSAVLEAASTVFCNWEKDSAIAQLLEFESTVLSSDVDAAAGAIEFGSIAAGRVLPPPQSELTAHLQPLFARSDLPLLFAHYGGVYFSYRVALQIDAIRVAARDLPLEEHDTALAAILSTTSDLVTSVGGHFAQPIRPRDPMGIVKAGVIRAAQSARRREAFGLFAEWSNRYNSRPPTCQPVHARRADYRDALDSLPEHVSAVYADPPYTREHYSRFYHVLETIALNDEPGIAPTPGRPAQPSRGLYRLERHQSPFSIVSRAPQAFAEIFGTLSQRNVPLVLSYSPVDGTSAKPRARVIGLESLTAIAKASYRNVELLVVDGVQHSRLNRRDLSVPMPAGAEILLTASNV